MSKIICHHEGKYNFYCTQWDSFVFVSSLTPEQVELVIRKEHGDNGLHELPKRLEQARKNGHSSKADGPGLDGFLCCNRAGENEAHLSTEECIAKFLS